MFFNKYYIRQSLCLILVFSLLGCKSSYKFNLYTRPSGALVRVGSNIEGETPCEIEIPADSAMIKDNHIDITYSLPDGRELTKSYDLSEYKTPNDFAGFMGAIFVVPGLLLFTLTETDEDDKYSPFDKEDDDEDDTKVQLVALGLIVLGGLVYWISGGDTKPLEGYDILETFEDIPQTSTN